MKTYENVKIELLLVASADIISTSYPLDGEGTETPILPSGSGGEAVTDAAGYASNY